MRNHTTTLQENVKLEAEDFPRMPPQKQHTLPNNKNVENTHTLATTNPQIDTEKNNQAPHAHTRKARLIEVMRRRPRLWGVTVR